MTNPQVPIHVAIVPDGNRRWAKQKGQSALAGHEAGAKVFETVIRHAGDRGVQYLSIWGMSLDNFTKRSPREVIGLLRLFKNEFIRLKNDPEVHQRKMRIRVLGRWQEKFPGPVRQAIVEAQEATKNYSNLFLNVMLAYSGIDEMIQAVKEIVKNHSGKRITAQNIKQHLFTRDLPPVDLVIRTGGEPHNSAGFMMWDTADSQLYFTEKYWPDFTTQEFDKALATYTKRTRRFGK